MVKISQILTPLKISHYYPRLVLEPRPVKINLYGSSLSVPRIPVSARRTRVTTMATNVALDTTMVYLYP